MISGGYYDGCVHKKDPLSVSRSTEGEGPAVPAFLSLLAEADLHAVHMYDCHGPRANTFALPINPALLTVHQSDS